MEIYSKESTIEIEVYDILKTVIDPELAVNIVDLGLIYKIRYSRENGIEIEMTLSSKGCPMGDIIIQDIEATIGKAFPDEKLAVSLVWSPEWTSDFITPEGRKKLGMSS